MTVSGEIRATGDLKTECLASVAALVYVQDSHHSEQAGPLAVTLLLGTSRSLTASTRHAH